MKKFIALIFVVLFAAVSFGDTETIDGVTYTFTISNGEATIGDGSSAAIPTSTSGSIVIPSTLGGCLVTTIGDYAFCGCGSLTSINIPDGVTTIGDWVFAGCRSLLSISIPDSVTTISDSLGIFSQVNIKCTRSNLEWIKKRFENNICFVDDDAYPELKGHEIVYENDAYCVYATRELISDYIPIFLDDEVVVKNVEGEFLSGIVFDKRNRVFRSNLGVGIDIRPESKNCEIAEKYNAYWIYRKVNASQIRILRVLPKWGGSEYCAGYMYVPNSVNIEYKEWICCSAVFEEIGVVRIPCELNGYEVVSIDEERIFRGLEGVNAVYFDSEADKNYGEGEYRYVAISECGKLVKVYDDEMKTGAWAEWLKKYGNDIAKLMSGTDSIYESQEGWSLTYPNWYNYVMGLDPGKMEDLKIDISIVDGKPVVSYMPEIDSDRAALRKYTVYGKADLTDTEWTELEPDAISGYNFFKVTVEMK